MLDNGAYSFWRKGTNSPDWGRFYTWIEEWLNPHTDFWIIPDVIDGSEQDNDKLIASRPGFHEAVPVWHLNESFKRLHWLAFRGDFRRIAFGSTREYPILSDEWKRRIDAAFNVISDKNGKVNIRVHMLGGLQCLSGDWPFSSADSTNLARSHASRKIDVRNIDSANPPSRWCCRGRLSSSFNGLSCRYDDEIFWGKKQLELPL